MQQELAHARALFNRQGFFAAHEAFEDLWRAAAGDDKDVLKAITQVAVALHHHSTGNLTGARGVLARAARGLASAPRRFHDLDLVRLRADLARWQAYLAGDAPQPPFPQL
ncbi:MAG TPA: DUF309 domain-containing protein [Terriglobales bacterium]|nr:DUF309 domain-containing protein [Terriglobales bacterium]